MSNDAELLRCYIEKNSEQAFAELVNRHLGLVYHAALRQTGGNAHRAQDVAQTVFVDLARKAKSLVHRPVLAGWLYTSTRYAAAKLARSEQRRQAREEGAQVMNDLVGEPAPVPDWNRLRTVIDDALYALGDRDREAVLLRFFEGRPFAEIGNKLAVSEDAARVRVDRALDKLRILLSRRGVTSTSVALATLLANEAVASAPAGLALKITGVALAGVAATGGATAVSTFIGMTKLQIGLTAAVVVAGGTVIVQQQHAQGAVRTQIAGLRQQQDQLARVSKENETLAQNIQEVPRIQPVLTDLSKLQAEIKELQEKKEEADSAAARFVRIAKLDEKRRGAAAPERTMTPEDMPYAPIVRTDDLDEKPIPVTLVEPKLTEAMRAQDLKATATVVLDTTGKPRNIKVINATTPEFAANVEEAVSKWVFKPAMVGRKPVSTWLTFRFSGKSDSAGLSKIAPTASNP